MACGTYGANKLWHVWGKQGAGFIPRFIQAAFVVGGLGFEFCVFVAGWRHALRSEWPFIIIIIIQAGVLLSGGSVCNVYILTTVIKGIHPGPALDGHWIVPGQVRTGKPSPGAHGDVCMVWGHVAV